MEMTLLNDLHDLFDGLISALDVIRNDERLFPDDFVTGRCQEEEKYQISRTNTLK